MIGELLQRLKRLDPRVSSLLLAVGLAAVIGGLSLIISAHSGVSAAGSAQTCERLATTPARFKCYKAYLGSIVTTKGPAAALKELDGLQQVPDTYAHNYCHPLAHAIGRAAYQRYKNPETALQYENNMCYTGYTHGVMESYMSKYDDAQLADMMPTICHEDPAHPRSLKYYDCVHGIGHGVMIRFNDDIFRSFPYCDRLATDWDKSACFNGIFMQNVVVDGDDHVSKFIKADDPLYPCDAVETRMEDPCYLIQANQILKVTHYDMTASFKWCDKAQAAFINSCYQSMGTQISSYADGDPAKVIDMCSKGNPDYQGFCYGSVAGDMGYRMQDARAADKLCLQVPDRYRPDCRQGQKALADML